MKLNEITREIIGAAIEVHRTLGAGLFESTYEACLCRELELRKMPFERQVHLPVNYKGVQIDISYRVDILVMGKVVVELKAVEQLAKIHEVQLVTYLKLGNWPVGLLINFNVPILKEGIRRKVNNYTE